MNFKICKNLVWMQITLFFMIVEKYALSYDVKPQKERYTPNYSIYHNISFIDLTLDELYLSGHGLVQPLKPIHRSRHGRNQHVLRITKGDANPNKVKVLLSFGEHAREFLPVESVLYLLRRLTNSTQPWEDSIDLSLFDIYVIVLANPDGRHYVEQTKNYCWRGTDTGVDINRNFAWEFGGQGSSANVNDEEYRGTEAFSEPEVKVYRDLTRKIRFDGFLSLHSGVRQIYIPFADSKSRRTDRIPDNIEEMKKLAHLLSKSTKHHYPYGTSFTLTKYTADGTVFDYMAGVRKIPFSYAIELWGPVKHDSLSCFDLFNPPSQNLRVVTEELYPMYITFFRYLQGWKSRQNDVQQRQASSNMPHPPEPLSDLDLEKRIAEDVPSVKPAVVLLCMLVMLTLLALVSERFPVCRRLYQRRRVVNLRALGSSLSINLFRTT